MHDTLGNGTRDWPLWWFSTLACAVERGDFDAAARAQRELERLGVRVRYGRPRQPQVAPRYHTGGAADE